ncbi:hypothetical protein F4821DRAFT_71568 [Hypoxylon rubiginosum]|uniref:Uncharacterized protein n=1 Tax=Hypoxylon rubiginosum TaxID=110542 RepID=A0ACC0CIE3_9PEZI|nr:hypothetical protein F4821DRAFT_71568 [Hypoxylon rubiginosum]
MEHHQSVIGNYGALIEQRKKFRDRNNTSASQANTNVSRPSTPDLSTTSTSETLERTSRSLASQGNSSGIVGPQPQRSGRPSYSSKIPPARQSNARQRKPTKYNPLPSQPPSSQRSSVQEPPGSSSRLQIPRAPTREAVIRDLVSCAEHLTTDKIDAKKLNSCLPVPNDVTNFMLVLPARLDLGRTKLSEANMLASQRQIADWLLYFNPYFLTVRAVQLAFSMAAMPRENREQQSDDQQLILTYNRAMAFSEMSHEISYKIVDVYERMQVVQSQIHHDILSQPSNPSLRARNMTAQKFAEIERQMSPNVSLQQLKKTWLEVSRVGSYLIKYKEELGDDVFYILPMQEHASIFGHKLIGQNAINITGPLEVINQMPGARSIPIQALVRNIGPHIRALHKAIADNDGDSTEESLLTIESTVDRFRNDYHIRAPISEQPVLRGGRAISSWEAITAMTD